MAIRPIYIALGLSEEGTALMLKPIVPDSVGPRPFQILLGELADAGKFEASCMVGQCILTALAAYHRDLKTRYHLPPQHPPALVPLRPQFPCGPMRRMRVGIGVAEDASRVLFKSCRGDEAPVEEGAASMALAELVTYPPKHASEHVGAVALFALSAWHQDAFAPFSERLY